MNVEFKNINSAKRAVYKISDSEVLQVVFCEGVFQLVKYPKKTIKLPKQKVNK